MQTIICSKCLAIALYQETGHDSDHRKFNLYFCDKCGNYTRDFMLTERETVDEALVTEALSVKVVTHEGNY